MKKEYVLAAIVGLFLLSYVLDATVNPLNLNLATPYDYLTPENLSKYPFTTASIVIKALGIFLIPVLLLSLADRKFAAKGLAVLILIPLMQLYALQDIATGAQVVPLEWSLSLSLAGIALAIPMVIYFILEALSKVHTSLKDTPSEEKDTTEEKSSNN